jgi:hypothetical protein
MPPLFALLAKPSRLKGVKQDPFLSSAHLTARLLLRYSYVHSAVAVVLPAHVRASCHLTSPKTGTGVGISE